MATAPVAMQWMSLGTRGQWTVCATKPSSFSQRWTRNGKVKHKKLLASTPPIWLDVLRVRVSSWMLLNRETARRAGPAVPGILGCSLWAQEFSARHLVSGFPDTQCVLVCASAWCVCVCACVPACVR
eukprot:651501-Pelagomonas_calceolata.AAC.1